MTTKLIAQIDGNLREKLLAQYGDRGSAAAAAVDEAATALRDELRSQVRQAGLGEGLANAFQLLPTSSKWRFAALVYSKATRLHRAFDQATTISAHNAQWLVLPTEAAVQAGLTTDRQRGQGGGIARKWSDVNQAIDTFGELRFVPLSGGQRALLVADARNLGRPRGTKKYKGGRGHDVALFLLVKQVHGRKLLDIEGAANRALTDLKARLHNILGGE